MTPVTGVFRTKTEAAQAIERLLKSGVKRENINVLTPTSSQEELARVPVSDTEQPGMGAAIGTLVGGAFGAAGGLTAGAALASFFVPGVGPILASGLLGAGLLGLGGAAGGAAVGEAMEENVPGLPHDELYVYEEALRQGRTVLIVQASDDLQAEAARLAFRNGGAESIDAAREQWWIGLRSAEKESYNAEGGDFASDEPQFREGFQAAQELAVRGKTYEQALAYLAVRYEVSHAHPAFRKGFERGKRYREVLQDQISYSGGLGLP